MPEETTKQAAPLAAGVRAPKHQMTFGALEALGPLQPDYVFFTPAVLYLRGALRESLLCELLEQHPGLLFMFHRFRLPLFAGLEIGTNTDWNHALWAVGRQYWAAVQSALAGYAVHDAATGRIVNSAAQYIKIADPLWVDRAGVVAVHAPRLEVIVFGLDSNEAQIGINAQTQPPRLWAWPPCDPPTRAAQPAPVRLADPAPLATRPEETIADIERGIKQYRDLQ